MTDVLAQVGDDAIRRILAEQVFPDGLDETGAARVTELVIDSGLIDADAPPRSLHGLAAFPNLRRLEIWGLRLESVDLTGAAALEELVASDNALRTIDLSAAPHLRDVRIGRNPLTELDLAKLPELETLWVDGTGRTELDLRGTPNLIDLRCFSNRLTVLDLSVTPKLRTLYCNDNLLTELDLSVLPELVNVGYSGNPIEPVTVRLGRAGTFASECGANFTRTRRIDGTDVVITAQTNDADVLERLRAPITTALGQLTALTAAARSHIASAVPDEAHTVAMMPLSEVEFDLDGATRLGFDAGDSPAGELVICVVFDTDLQPLDDLVYEVY